MVIESIKPKSLVLLLLYGIIINILKEWSKVEMVLPASYVAIKEEEMWFDQRDSNKNNGGLTSNVDTNFISVRDRFYSNYFINVFHKWILQWYYWSLRFIHDAFSLILNEKRKKVDIYYSLEKFYTFSVIVFVIDEEESGELAHGWYTVKLEYTRITKVGQEMEKLKWGLEQPQLFYGA